jgi:hypothetical protein
MEDEEDDKMGREVTRTTMNNATEFLTQAQLAEASACGVIG